MTDPDEMGTATPESLRAADACAPGVASVAPPPPPAPRLPLIWQHRQLMVPKGQRGPRPVAVQPEPGIPRVPHWLVKPAICVGVCTLTMALAGPVLDAWAQRERREADLVHDIAASLSRADDRAAETRASMRVLERSLDLLHADLVVIEARMRADRARGWGRAKHTHGTKE